jgi:hypothetical protein
MMVVPERAVRAHGLVGTSAANGTATPTTVRIQASTPPALGPGERVMRTVERNAAPSARSCAEARSSVTGAPRGSAQ